jgi:hypothetical protein
MHIIINEHQEVLLEDYVAPSGMREKVKKVDSEKMELEDYIEKHGEYMTDVTNGKTYLVQYLRALSELVGRKYAMCAPVRSNGTYGAFYVKPLETFVKKQSVAVHKDARQVPVKKNMYQQMGLNK